MNGFSEADRLRTAAWRVQLGVHGVLAAMVIAPVDSQAGPHGVVLGDLDELTASLAEAEPVLGAHDPPLVADIRAGLDAANAGQSGAAVRHLLAAWDRLAALSDAGLTLPLPPLQGRHPNT